MERRGVKAFLRIAYSNQNYFDHVKWFITVSSNKQQKCNLCFSFTAKKFMFEERLPIIFRLSLVIFPLIFFNLSFLSGRTFDWNLAALNYFDGHLASLFLITKLSFGYSSLYFKCHMEKTPNQKNGSKNLFSRKIYKFKS